MSRFLIFSIRLYQVAISPYLGRWCRFDPSCSEYACQALKTQGLVHGIWVSMKRICRCHPFCEGGHDPVPMKKQSLILGSWSKLKTEP